MLVFSPTFILKAQLLEGRIVYSEKMSFKPDSNKMKMYGQPGMGMQMPAMPQQKMELLFRGDSSLWQSVVADTPMPDMNRGGHDGGGMMYMMRQDKQEEKMFVIRTEKKVIENRSILDKLFLIKSDLKTRQWKITGEQDTVAGYTCMKALLANDSNIVVAWFTPQIPVSVGPKDYGQLPGAILKLDFENGKRVYRALSVELNPIAIDAMIVPSKGKEVTDEEFRQLRKEKMKELGMSNEGNGSPGNIQIMMVK